MENLTEVHRYLSVDCFNKTWEYIDKENRSKEEDEQMLLLSLTSLWHWTQREDCTPNKLSISRWLISRVYALLGDGANSLIYAKKCLLNADKKQPFFVSYGHEAIARAEALLGNVQESEKHLELGLSSAEKIKDPDDKEMLLEDLKGLK